MSTQTHFHKRQAALRVRRSENTRSRQRGRVLLGVVRHEELIRWLRSEALDAVPCHILNHQKGTVGYEDVVQGAVANDGFVQTFDHAREDRKATRRGAVTAVDKDVVIGTFHPGLDGGVDGFLDVRTIEID